MGDEEKLDGLSEIVKTQEELDVIHQGIEAKLRNGELGNYSGILSVPGTLWGHTEKFAVISGAELNLYNTIEDYVVCIPTLTINLPKMKISCLKEGDDFFLAFTPQTEEEQEKHSFLVSKALVVVWFEKLNAAMKQHGQGILTPEENLVLLQAKERLHLEDEKERDLLRFLRAHHFDLERAVAAWQNCLVWRAKFGCEKLTIDRTATPFLNATMRILPHPDKQGRPILVLTPYRYLHTILDVVKMFVYALEHVAKRLATPDSPDNVLIIVDLNYVNRKNFDLRISRTVNEILQSYYPNRIHRFLIVNPPWFFRFAFATIRTFMNPRLVEKVQILGNDLSLLKLYVDPQSLLSLHGGSLNFDEKEFVNERATEEGVEIGGKASHTDIIDPVLLASYCTGDVAVSVVLQESIYKGHLSKMGGLIKSWKRRFFVLTENGLLYYFKDESASSQQKVISLEHCHVHAGPSPSPSPSPSSSSSSSSSRPILTLTTPTREYVFAAETVEQQTMWVQVLDEAIKRVGKLAVEVPSSPQNPL